MIMLMRHLLKPTKLSKNFTVSGIIALVGSIQGSSTSVLVLGCWLMNHVIYLRLGQKRSCKKAEKIKKMASIFTQNNGFFF